MKRLIAICVAVFGLAAAPAMAEWTPELGHELTWYWQLQGTVKVEPVDVSDFDGFDNTEATVAQFHALNQHTICYIDVGTWESWREDADDFPDSVKGRSNGFPGEKWLDIRQLSVLKPIMTARFQDMCKNKGFDAVEPDNMDGYSNRTGFPLTADQQLTYNKWVADTVHGMGMAVFQKNDPEQASELESHFDGAITEQCNQYGECRSFLPYLMAGKPVLNAEYKRSLYPRFCAADANLEEEGGYGKIMGALFNTALDGKTFKPCPSEPDFVGSLGGTGVPALN